MSTGWPMEEQAPVRDVGMVPDPPPGRMGWPWGPEGYGEAVARCSGHPAPPAARAPEPPARWPRITVVTPSYNQAEFLEATLRSVLLQEYPDLEYIVMDGGSDDGSVEIIRRYEPWLAHWVSEPDGGQSHAINKGFRRATGEVLAWLNSDDIYYPGALASAGRAFADGDCDIFLGAMDKVQVDGEQVRFVKRSDPWTGRPMHPWTVLRSGRRHDFHFYQPSMFWRTDIWQRAGELDERYHYMMDMEWCNRALAAGASVCTGERVLTRFTLHPGSKTQDFRHRQLFDEALMYVRLGRDPAFRTLPCLGAALRPLQGGLAMSASLAAADRGGVRAGLYRGAARALRALRLLLPRENETAARQPDAASTAAGGAGPGRGERR